jgi:Cdc6-like AAA superfamily ATPase
MAYQPDMAAVFRSVFADRDIRIVLDTRELSLSRQFVERELQSHFAAVLEQAQGEIAEFNAAANQLQGARQKLRAVDDLPDDLLIALGFDLSLVILAVIVGAIALVLHKLNLALVWEWLLTHPWVSVPIGLVLVWPGIIAPVRALFHQAKRRDPAVPSLRRDVATLQAESDALRSSADEAVARAAVQIARQIVNAAIVPFFQDRLVVDRGIGEASGAERVTSGQGLAEIVNSANEVATEARQRLSSTIRELPGASIGIAGPRGVGKSTLLLSICNAPSEIDDQPSLTVYTSAPVQYEPRDFLLHLFAAVCTQVLIANDVADDRSLEGADTGDPEASALRGIVLRLAVVLLVVGVTIASFGLALAVFEMSDPAFQPRPGLAGPTTTHPTLLSTLDIKPGPLVTSGAVAVLLGVLSIFAIRSRYLSDTGLTASSGRRASLPVDNVPASDDLVDICRERLRDIRFQRSFSSGWSGSLNALAGTALTLSRARSIAQTQLSLPDIVARFRELLLRITDEYARVIVAIDELDKLTSDEKAQNFVNEIKAVFNVPNCFFLISVSEQAISSFERRGLRFRDAFDSAFDDIQYVGYLEYRWSKNLLDRRVVNFPYNFLAMCHAISGGLPRDLIRTARSFLQNARNLPLPAAQTCCKAVLSRDLESKIRATEFAVGVQALEPETSSIQAWIATLDGWDIDSTEFRKAAFTPVVFNERKSATEDERIRFSRLRELYNDLQAYIAHALTVLDRFATVQSTTPAEEVASMAENLARARQGLEVSAAIARSRIQRIRTAASLAELWPAASVA